MSPSLHPDRTPVTYHIEIEKVDEKADVDPCCPKMLTQL